jgi:hypothetical protein
MEKSSLGWILPTHRTESALAFLDQLALVSLVHLFQQLGTGPAMLKTLPRITRRITGKPRVAKAMRHQNFWSCGNCIIVPAYFTKAAPGSFQNRAAVPY